MKLRRPARPRSAKVAVVSVVLALALSVVAAQCWFPQVHPHAAQPNHPATTVLGGDYAKHGDHAHLSDNSKPPCPDQAAIAVLPRVAQPALDSSVAAAAETVPVPVYQLVSSGRGPPEWQWSAISGRDLLTRYCLSRR
ncbi:hypothetical protein [Mycobacterium bourgelatii]|nr:hypothetical protein [Mycobacterium bourgelatii]MCV6975270.1 hypothetical protein [Mycobacterium bourgelatii]